MRRLLFLFACFCFTMKLQAQVETQTVQVNSNIYDDTKLLYRNEQTFGLVIHSNGFGIDYRRGKHVTAMRKRVFEFEFVNYRHAKEVKTSNPYYDAAKGYYYGKLNSFLILRPGIGYQNVIYTKPEHNGVEVRYVIFIGPSLGFAKPVYLEILEKTTTPPQEVVVEKYDPTKHFTDNIYGRAPYLRGLSETKLYPGGYVKLGLNFEYAPLDDMVRGIETGICLDIYPKVIPIMATQHNHQVLVSLYLQFTFGRKWF